MKLAVPLVAAALTALVAVAWPRPRPVPFQPSPPVASATPAAATPPAPLPAAPLPPASLPPVDDDYGNYFKFLMAVRAGDIPAIERHYRPSSSLTEALEDGARWGHVDVLAWLVAHGASVHHHQDDWGAPMLAGDEYPDVVAFFHEHGVPDPPAEEAAAANAANTFFRVLETQEHVDLNDALWRTTAATTGPTSGKLRILRALLDRGANVNAKTYEMTPLDHALMNCGYRSFQLSVDCLPVVKLLLARGARVDTSARDLANRIDPPERQIVLEVLRRRH